MPRPYIDSSNLLSPYNRPSRAYLDLDYLDYSSRPSRARLDLDYLDYLYNSGVPLPSSYFYLFSRYLALTTRIYTKGL